MGEDFCLFSGNDDMIVPILSLGGCGVISVWANICPKQCHELVERWQAGDVAGARAIQLEYLSLINALFCEVNPIPVKAALHKLQLCHDELRLPLTPMRTELRTALFDALRQMAEGKMETPIRSGRLLA